MEFLKKVWNLFAYAGVDKKEYRKLLPSVYKENQQILKVFSVIAAVIFFALFVVSALSKGFANVNAPTYLVCGVIMLVLMLCVFFLTPKHPSLVLVLVYVFETVLYVFGIFVSMLHAEKPAVSAVAFLLVSPLLFYDFPARLTSQLSIVVVAFCIIVKLVKEPEVASTDIWNMITFGIVAVFATIFIMQIKFRALSQSRQIEYMSQTDLLTGVKNRNHYENRMQEYPELCSSNLICIYGDVNGLHELNIQEGHLAGDIMLQKVAEIMRLRFGEEHTYRIGGDEFVAFRPDDRPEQVKSEIDGMDKEITELGYRVSFGFAEQSKENGKLDMSELVKEAEENMFLVKKEFYSKPENRKNTSRMH